jgi:hypothetical protein
VQLSKRVLAILATEKIAEEELCLMLDSAAITSVRGFNRRYFHWLFKVSGDVLVDMQHEKHLETGKGDTVMFEDHDACDGAGCKACGWIGQVKRWVKDKPLPKHEPLLLRR